MKLVFSQAMFACFVLAFYLGIRTSYTRELKYKENRLFSTLCFSSAIWSFGFFEVILQTDIDRAYFWRAIGMIGVFSYLIVVQALVCQLADIGRRISAFMKVFSLTGIVIFFFVIQNEQVIYEMSEVGMTYYFKPGFWNTMYTVYSLIMAVNIFIVILYMIRCREEKRLKVLGKKFLIAELVLVIGMVWDTILPLMGKQALPGSTLGQFVAVFVLYRAVGFINRSRINIINMSEFVYRSISTPILVYDSLRRLQILNDAAFNFLGIEEGNVTNISISQLFQLQEKEAFEFEGNSRDVDSICYRNQIPCNLAINKIHDHYNDNIGYIIIVTDLSERMKIVQELEEAVKDAQEANEAKSMFLANMSHEIRTPMNAIIGFSELLLKMDISDEAREQVEDIKCSAHNLLAIINDILDISKIESGKMELVLGKYYTSGLLKDVSLIINSQAKQKGLEFNMKVDPGLPNRLYGDKVRLRGILVNILNNAVKYTKKGSVNFEVSVISRTSKLVRLEFKVSDTGVGIRPEDQKNLFKNFERLERKVHYGVEGSGLGLAIANGYVTLMGGEIKVSSVYGKGSVFTVIVEQEIIDPNPMDENHFSGERQSENALGEMQIFGVQVLVVDDNMVNLRVASRIMASYGFQVDTASSGMEAIELCLKKKYKLVFMDQMMPEMNGVEAMQKIRAMNQYYAHGGESKIIVLTADAISGARQSLMERGFDEYLGKPMNLKQMERLFVRFLPPETICFRKEEESQEDRKGQEKDKDYLKEILAPVDIEKGIANCGGDISDYLKVLKITYDYGEKQLEELENMEKNQKYEDYTIKIHSIKSTALNMGAVKVSEMAKAQEMAGREGNYSYIDEHMELFLIEYRTLLHKIEDVLRHYGMIDEVREEGVEEELDKEMILRILKNIYQCVDDFDFSKVFDILEEVKRYSLPEEYQEVFEQIGAWMDELAVDKIKELIEKTAKERRKYDEE